MNQSRMRIWLDHVDFAENALLVSLGDIFQC